MPQDNSLQIARDVFRIEAAAVAGLAERLDERFLQAIELIFSCTGRIIITGIGKSGLVGKKIAATLSSTGTPSLFLHSAEGLHGDLGVVLKEDVIIYISKSGAGEEFQTLLSLFRRLGVSIIAITSNPSSELGRHADVVLDVSVKEEACPFDLAPTASSTATLAMGDALAVALLRKRKFTEQDFAMRHPGGKLGRRLLMRIEDLMGENDKIPVVKMDTPLKDVILEISKKRYGATCVLDSNDRLIGIITDGDLRRRLASAPEFYAMKAEDVMCAGPKTVTRGTLVTKALALMEKHNIMQIIIIEKDGRLAGIIHLHDLLKAGIV